MQITKFTPDTVSAGEDAINGCLQSGGDCCLELLGESLEEREYLRQIEQVYFECGATNFRQAHFFLDVFNRLMVAEKMLDEMDVEWHEAVERITDLEHGYDKS